MHVGVTPPLAPDELLDEFATLLESTELDTLPVLDAEVLALTPTPPSPPLALTLVATLALASAPPPSPELALTLTLADPPPEPPADADGTTSTPLEHPAFNAMTIAAVTSWPKLHRPEKREALRVTARSVLEDWFRMVAPFSWGPRMKSFRALVPRIIFWPRRSVT